jgi:hypothetical protein
VHRNNDASVRRQEFEGSLDAFRAAELAHNVSDAQDALKRALEAIHALYDSAAENPHDVRSDWSYSAWSPFERELLRGFIGARNAAHHFNWSPVSWHLDPGGRAEMRWQSALPAIRDPRGDLRAAYTAQLEGKRVLPLLKTMRGVLAKSVP